MRKLLIFGNSGSGKSTLALNLHQDVGLSHLDLDGLAWEPTSPPTRKPLEESASNILSFISASENWVIEGCYSDLLTIALPHANEIIFLNLPIEDCIENAKNRPWEPHKYETKAAQDANLNMLIEWISEYRKRDDTFSESAHLEIYNGFDGKKSMYTSNRHEWRPE